MDRRRFLGMVGATAGLAGCMGVSSDGTPTDSATDTPTATATPTDTAAGASDPAEFDTLVQDGTEVPLVPIDVAYDWYQQDSARFADARGSFSYQRAHVQGAVLSPAPDGQGENDPVEAWPTDTRIVTYCACPHHLSSMRAASLIQGGYGSVYALDEGFGEWAAREYPMAGNRIQTQLAEYVVAGRTDPADAGDDAWARHEPTGQREATRIGADGRYELVLPFADVTADAPITVETPSYTLTASLGELTSGRVTTEGRVTGGTQA